MPTYTNQMSFNYDASMRGTSQSYDIPEGTRESANYSITGFDTQAAPTLSVDYKNKVVVINFPSDPINDEIGSFLLTITQDRGFQDLTGTFAAGPVTKLSSSANPTLSIDQQVAGVVRFDFGIPAGEKGKDGKSAYEIAVAGGYSGTEGEWLASLKAKDGVNGKSVYQLAVDAGFVGTEAQWLETLKGSQGDSAYRVAVAGGYVGTEAQWVASLKGEKGDTSPATLPYKELASGVLWYCRPRNTQSFVNGKFGPFVESIPSQNFVIEDDLFEESGVHIPPTNIQGPSAPRLVTPRQTKGVNRGIYSKGRYTANSRPEHTSENGKFIDADEWALHGHYYVMLSPEESANFTQENLGKIEVDVASTYDQGYMVISYVMSNPPTPAVSTAPHRGVLFPFYRGASLHTTAEGKNIVALWFRVMTYTFRRNTATVADVHQWDGINGEDGGWALGDPDVKWWSTNVAQGMKFTAKIRN